MSFIPARKMPHVTAQEGEFDAETGKIVHLNPEGAAERLLSHLPSLPEVPRAGWIAGGASLAAAVALGAFLSLRSSSSRKTSARRRPRTTTTAAKKTATPRRRKTTSTAKRSTKAA